MTEDKIIKETTSKIGDTSQKTTSISQSDDNPKKYNRLDQKIIWFLACILIVILSFRFILSLLGANPYNSFANFIYKISNPLLSPFFSLFNYHGQLTGNSHFETYTLVGIIFYAIIAWGISKLTLIL